MGAGDEHHLVVGAGDEHHLVVGAGDEHHLGDAVERTVPVVEAVPVFEVGVRDDVVYGRCKSPARNVVRLA